MEKTAGTAELERSGGAYETSAKIQESTAFMPDYDFKSAGEDGSTFGTTTAGIVGGALTLLLACAVGAAIAVFKKRGGKNMPA
jgi:cobalt/nickel transport system permease protein